MSTKAVSALQAAVIIGFASASLVACSQQPAEPESPVPSSPLPPSEDQRLSEIRAALSERNYGSAAQLAKVAQSDFPLSPDAHLLAAQAEGYLGNAGNAAAAFQKSIDAGLSQPGAALSNAAFDSVRGSTAFLRIREALAGPARTAERAPRAESRPDRVRAGDVEIITDGSGDYIRAGDIVLDTRN